MPLNYKSGWNSPENHTSDRSQNEVTRIINEIPTLTLAFDFSNEAVALAITMNFEIDIIKGIHEDSRGTHITIFVPQTGRTWHLYLKQIDRRENTFVWQVNEIR